MNWVNKLKSEVNMFVDKAEIFLKAGDGGHGGMSFRREKYVPNGGPDGGDGGKGGNIVFVADQSLRTLAPFKYKRKYKADNGGNGSGGRSSGKSVEDLVIKVPVGTIIKNRESNRIICDLSEDGQRFIGAQGGRGGKGNMNYATATRQAPRFAQGGVKGQEKALVLELKLLADVGLIGFPNVGKSTFLSVVSKAKPKIANYHFTTITPNLGVVEWKNAEPFVIADIPGLIENAHKGTGLGDQFLRHIERTKLLLHFLDVSSSEGRDPLEDFEIINKELQNYNEKLSQRVQLVVLNKVDLLEDQETAKVIAQKLEHQGYEVFSISAVTHLGLEPLLKRLVILLGEIGQVEPIFEVEVESEEKVSEKEFTIERQGHVFIVKGAFLERLINSVNFDDLDSVGYFQRVLKDKGIFKELENMNIQDEDLVRLNEIEFEYFS